MKLQTASLSRLNSFISVFNGRSRVFSKNFQVLFFFSVIFLLLMYIFKKTCSNLARECVISDNNREKLDES